MIGEQNEQLIQFFRNSQQQQPNQVKLRLYKPRFCSKKLTLSDLFELKEKCPLLKRFSLEQINKQENQSLLLCFQSVDDAIQFQISEKQNLTYSMSLIESQDYEQTQKAFQRAFTPSKIQEQILQQGFIVQNGEIKLNKITSMDDLVQINMKSDQLSTLICTDRKISLQDQIQDLDEQQQDKINQIFQQKEENHIKLLASGAILTGLVYGGFKLFRYFIKF